MERHFKTKSLLNLVFLFSNLKYTASYFTTDSVVAFCPLVDYKGTTLYFIDNNSVLKSIGSGRMTTECSLVCFEDGGCKGFTFSLLNNNCTVHYSTPNNKLLMPEQYPKTITYMTEGFQIYPYRYPYPCIRPFTLAGRLYNDTCATIKTGISTCDYQVCPVQIGSTIEMRQCTVPDDNITKSIISPTLLTCQNNRKQITTFQTDKTWILVQHKKFKYLQINFDQPLRNFTQYKQGFGNINDDYWIGNDWLYGITSGMCTPFQKGDYRLRVEFSDQNGYWYSVEYKYFRVLSELNNYKLNISGYDYILSDVADGFYITDQPASSSSPNNTKPPWANLNCTQPCKVMNFSTNDTNQVTGPRNCITTCLSNCTGDCNIYNTNCTSGCTDGCTQKCTEPCTLPTGWWYNMSQLSECQSSVYSGNLNAPGNKWPNKRGFQPAFISPVETRMYITMG